MKNIKLNFGLVTNKKIITPNDFVSHMIEHIAWRTGTEIDLQWDNENWYKLGQTYGAEFLSISNTPKQNSTTTIGMIDDGTAQIKITQTDSPELKIDSTDNIDLNLFLNNRCEQIDNHTPLTEFLKGLTETSKSKIEVLICNHRDSHHTWEGVFRGIGISLAKMFSPENEQINISEIDKVEKNCSEGNISVLQRSLLKSEVIRGTAESGVKVAIDLEGNPAESTFSCEVGESIQNATKNLDKLFMILAESLNAKINIDFKAKALSSSHVVLEDIGLVMGKSLFEILNLRFEQLGANGAGSSIQNPAEFNTQNGSIGISVEGRKLWQFIPSDGDFKKLNNQFLQFQDVFGTIRSEDLDDFFDGLSGGMMASVMVHTDNIDNPNLLWQEIFKNLGTALKEVLEINISRKGVPPGVKATLS